MYLMVNVLQQNFLQTTLSRRNHDLATTIFGKRDKTSYHRNSNRDSFRASSW